MSDAPLLIHDDAPPDHSVASIDSVSPTWPEIARTPPTRSSFADQPPLIRLPDPVNVTIMAPSDVGAWKSFVGAHPQATLFHTLSWSDAVTNSFPHRSMHLIARRGSRIAGVLPLFLVQSRLAGRMLVSVPYGVGGGILADDPDGAAALIDRVKELGRMHRARVIELRSRHAALTDAPIDDRYVTFERELPDRPDDVLDFLPRKARAAARNGRDKFGLVAEFGDHLLPEVWNLYARSMRRLASITYPRHFFHALLAATEHHHWVCLVQRGGESQRNERRRDGCGGGQPVAGLITFLFRDRVLPYFVGLSDEAARCSAANFIYFVTMQRAVAAGYRIFDFGRTRRDNTGSFDFKRFHGFEPAPLAYQRISLDEKPPRRLGPTDARFRLVRRFWPHLPLGITNWLGATLSRDIPG